MIEEQSFEEPKSKSQIKREMLALRDLGVQLVELPKSTLKKVPMSDTLRDAVIAAKGFKKEALRRQLQYIGSVMRSEDAEVIRQTLEALAQPQREEISAFHEIEEWRDALVGGNDELLTDLMSRFQNIDHQYLRQLVRNARRELQMNKPPKSARALFQYLKEMQQYG